MTSAREAYFSIQGDCSVAILLLNWIQLLSNYFLADGPPCSRGQDELNGISFKASYKPLAGENFFSRLITFSEVTQECPFDVFVPIDGDYTAHGLSMQTECPLLSLGELIFTEMSHVMNIIGSSPDCFQDDFLGVPDPALVIHSNLKNERLPLGKFLELQKNRDGDDMTVVFGQNKVDFVAILHSVKVSLFGNSFNVTGRIENNVLEISGDASVFLYPAYVHISALVNETEWNKLIFSVRGRMLPGKESMSFLDTLSNTVLHQLRQTAESGGSRETAAQMSHDQAMERLNRTSFQYNQSLAAVNEANESYNLALLNIEIARSRVLDAQRVFNSSNEDLQTLEKGLSMLCTEKVCENECMRGNSCRSCFKPTFVEKTGRCPTTVKERREFRVPPLFEQRTTWEWRTECLTESYLQCFESGCPVGQRIVCRAKCVPVFTTQVPVYNWVTIEVEVRTYKACTVQVVNSSIPSTCCEITDCAVFAPNSSCVSANAQCRQYREAALDSVAEAREDIRKPFEDLQAARKNLSLAQTAATVALLKLQTSEQRRNQLFLTLERIRAASSRAENVYRQTLQQIAPFIAIAGIIEENDLGNVFNITAVHFSSTFMIQSPGDLSVDILYETPHNNEKYEETFVYHESLGTENIQQIADQIIDNIFAQITKRNVESKQRVQRQLMEETTKLQIFGTRCTHVQNTKLFLSDIQEKLQGIQQSIDAAYENIELRLLQNFTEMDPSEAVNLTVLETEFNVSITDQEQVEDEELTAYKELLKSYEDLSAESLADLERNVFDEWQASMEYLYSESGSVGVYDCDGFADCLQTSVDQLRNLISLTPETELSEHVLMLLESLPVAEKQLLDLGVAGNITLQEALEKISPIVNIVNSYAKDNYWCNSPPVIILQPPPEVNVSLGATLRLLCEANSTLSLTYEWKKDGNTLPEVTTNELAIANLQRLDSGNYTCFANNPAGSAESVTTSVTVYELPSFYLLPQSVATYFGDDNGAWFACNASAWPYPGWRWYYRTSEEMEWTLIEGEETNELLIPEPQKEHEGWYMCEAYNYHGSIRSEPVSLLLLPFSVSQHQYPLDFSITKDNGNSSCSSDELYNTVYQKLLEAKGSDTTAVTGLSVRQVDAVNYDISLSLSSENVTTRYLHLMSFAEIANAALPKAVDLRSSVESVTQAFDQDSVIISCQGAEFTVVPESVVVDKLTYVCPLGQELNSDYLLCGM